MPSVPHTATFSPTATEVRLQLKPAAPATGFVDGAWWPRSRDLSTELPALLTAMAARLSRIDRVTYSLDEWPETRHRLVFDDHVVRLEGFRSQRPGSLTVIGGDRDRLTLLVVPPEADDAVAQHALATAAAPGNTDDGTLLLAGRGPEADGVPQPA
ncbi:MAG TPA: DUF5994 family protein [Amycolatopsis sp.]|nr:DUF5994 family protein [Amycolatopsis sp.]